VEIRHYATFTEALKDIELERVLPGVKSIEEGVKIYEQFYPLESQIEHGVVLFRLTKRS
jgi:ASC-1-like (ASCH) protein